jgi:hypothetical protein
MQGFFVYSNFDTGVKCVKITRFSQNVTQFSHLKTTGSNINTLFFSLLQVF